MATFTATKHPSKINNSNKKKKKKKKRKHAQLVFDVVVASEPSLNNAKRKQDVLAPTAEEQRHDLLWGLGWFVQKSASQQRWKEIRPNRATCVLEVTDLTEGSSSRVENRNATVQKVKIQPLDVETVQCVKVETVKNQPVKVQKYFDSGWFEGTVTSSRVDEVGEKLYFILYEDDDREEVDECELKILVDYYHANRKAKAAAGDVDDEVIDLCTDDDEVEEFSRPRNKKSKHGENRQPAQPKKAKNGFKQHNSHDSSLWKTLPPVNGEPVTRELIAALAAERAPKGLPVPLHCRIPEMVEFFVLMLERQLIQQGKKNDTELFQKFHWCNNYRELDRGTAYFRSQVLKLVEETPTPMSRLQYTEEVLGMAYYYRQCNLIESFIHPDNPAGGIPRLGKFDAAFVHYVKTYQRDRKTFFTAAHINQGLDRYMGYCKSSEALLRKIANEIADMEGFDMHRICKCLRNLPGVGSFLSWQIACDLEEACCFAPKVRITDSGVEEQVELEDSFCVLGPGAERGLRKIFGDDIYRRVRSKGSVLGLSLFLRDNMDYCLSLVGQEFPLWKNRKVTLKVLEHALCEFQKFAEIELGCTQGQRRWHSRAQMDKRNGCCGQRMIRCDTCHYIGCEGCQEDMFQTIKPEVGFGWNCCQRCHALDQLVLLD